MQIRTVEELQRTVGAYRHARIIQAGVKLRLFDYTRSSRPASAAEVAAGAGISERGADILLDALAAMGLLTKEGDRYGNSGLAEEYLVTDCGRLLIHSIDHSEQIYRRWAFLPEAARNGMYRSDRDAPSVSNDPEINRVFIRAMHARGLERGRAIAAALDLEGVRKVGDAGGGSGAYLIALGERIPEMEGYLFDLPLTLNTAAEILREYGPTAQIHKVECDLFNGDDPFGTDFDLILLSNIIHIVGPDQNQRLFRRIRRSLRNGGRLVLQDFLLDDTGTRPLDAAVFAVNMLTGTETGRSWRESDVRQWLMDAGFTSVNRLDSGSDSDVLVAA